MIIHLVRSLDSIKVPAARALIIWMMGEYNCIGQTISRILATVVKYLGWCFTSEAVETKLQILTATAKVFLNLSYPSFIQCSSCSPICHRFEKKFYVLDFGISGNI